MSKPDVVGQFIAQMNTEKKLRTKANKSTRPEYKRSFTCREIPGTVIEGVWLCPIYMKNATYKCNLDPNHVVNEPHWVSTAINHLRWIILCDTCKNELIEDQNR